MSDRIRINGKSLSISSPADYTVITVSSVDFAKSTERFMNDLFGGAFLLSVDRRAACGYIDIAPRGFAYFMKLLLFSLQGNACAHTEIHCSDKEVRISVEYGDCEIPLANLITTAEASGFLVTESSVGRLVITTAVTRARYLAVYNPTPDLFAKYLFEVFFM